MLTGEPTRIENEYMLGPIVFHVGSVFFLRLQKVNDASRVGVLERTQLNEEAFRRARFISVCAADGQTKMNIDISRCVDFNSLSAHCGGPQNGRVSRAVLMAAE
jgi:hypothetical protein